MEKKKEAIEQTLNIVNVVAEHFGVKPEDIISGKKMPNLPCPAVS